MKKKLSPKGEIIEVTVEESCDVETKIKARKELDRILGITTLPDLGSLQMGDITINIVDASKTEEVEDERNKIELKDKDVIEVSDEDEGSKRERFFNR